VLVAFSPYPSTHLYWPIGGPNFRIWPAGFWPVYLGPRWAAPPAPRSGRRPRLRSRGGQPVETLSERNRAASMSVVVAHPDSPNSPGWVGHQQSDMLGHVAAGRRRHNQHPSADSGGPEGPGGSGRPSGNR